MGLINKRTATTTSRRDKGTQGMKRRSAPANVAAREQVLAEETAAHAAAHEMTVPQYLAWAAAEGQKSWQTPARTSGANESKPPSANNNLAHAGGKT